MRSIGNSLLEIPELCYWKIRSTIYEYLEQKKVAKLFYNDRQFAARDQAILRSCNPYAIDRAFPYGETPLCTLKAIADIAELGASDHIFDLGCGRGRGANFLAWYTQAKVTGIDYIPQFIQEAKQLNIPNASFIEGDYTAIEYVGATFIYLYGTAAQESVLKKIRQRLMLEPRKIVIASVSHPIDDLHIINTVDLPFPWGKGRVYFQIHSGMPILDSHVRARKTEAAKANERF